MLPPLSLDGLDIFLSEKNSPGNPTGWIRKALLGRKTSHQALRCSPDLDMEEAIAIISLLRRGG
jgi:hypothetical protein